MKKAFMARDVDEMYKPDTGERVLPACEMNEKIYLIVRSIQDRNVKQPSILSKSDIIKLGRVKFKVKDIYIAKNERAKADKREQMRRREETWRKKQLALAEQRKSKLNLFYSNPGKQAKLNEKDILLGQQPEQVLNSSRIPEPISESVHGNKDKELFMRKERPAYFDRFKDVDLDSEQEQAVGENNYIEIDAMPLEEQKIEPPVLEEEKKEENKQEPQRKRKKVMRSNSFSMNRKK